MKKVYLLYETDPWHSYSSMTPNSLVGVATTENNLKKLLEERLKTGHTDDILELVNDGEFKSPKEFFDKALEDFKNNRNQTQSLSEYIGVEFYAEEVETNTVVF